MHTIKCGVGINTWEGLLTIIIMLQNSWRNVNEMSEDPQITIANWFWNKINSKGTSTRKGWRNSGSFPGIECSPSPGRGHFLRIAPWLSWQMPDTCFETWRHFACTHFQLKWIHQSSKVSLGTHRHDFLWVGWQYSFPLVWTESSQSWRFRWCLRLCPSPTLCPGV